MREPQISFPHCVTHRPHLIFEPTTRHERRSHVAVFARMALGIESLHRVSQQNEQRGSRTEQQNHHDEHGQHRLHGSRAYAKHTLTSVRLSIILSCSFDTTDTKKLGPWSNARPHSGDRTPSFLRHSGVAARLTPPCPIRRTRSMRRPNTVTITQKRTAVPFDLYLYTAEVGQTTIKSGSGERDRNVRPGRIGRDP